LAQESGADIKTAVGIAKTAGIVTIGSIIIFGTIFGFMFHEMEYTEAFVNPQTYDPLNN
jgi:hypothetical protein